MSTPLARIVDLGTEFDVLVKDAGVTETFVRTRADFSSVKRGPRIAGKSHRRWQPGRWIARPFRSTAMRSKARLVTTVVRGSESRFLGRMTVQGKSAEFRSQPDFDAFRVEAFKQLGDDAGQFVHKWPGLADAAGRSKRGEVPPGTVPINPRPNSAAAASRSKVPPAAGVDDQTVEVEDNGKKVSITDSEESGITVTITESVNGKKTTKVRAADTADFGQEGPGGP